MRLTRRAALAGIGAFALPGAAQAIEQTRFAVGVSVRPIAAFEPRRPDQRRFGALQFRGGLVLSSGHPRFGGLSGLARLNGGRDLVAVSDRGYWLTAKVASSNGRLTGLDEVEMAAILGGSGRPLARSGLYDTESLCIHDGAAYVGIERKHEIARFDWARDGVEARARSVPVPPELKRLPRNRGLEALGVMPAGPLKGALVAIAERSGKEEEPTLGAILGGRSPVCSGLPGMTATTSPISPSCPPATCCCWSAGTSRCAASACGSGESPGAIFGRAPWWMASA